jgi:hypothetical protein
MSDVGDDPEVARIVSLLRRFLEIDDGELKRFIESNPSVVREDTHQYFKILVDKAIPGIRDPERHRMIADRMELLRGCIESGPSLAFQVYGLSHPVQPPQPGLARHCDQCGGSLGTASRFCPACGQPVREQLGRPSPAYSAAHEELFVEAEEGEVAWGRSVFMNVFAGAPSVVKCRFVVRRVTRESTVEVGSRPFNKEVNVPIEDMSGMYRKQAQEVLEEIDTAATADGWQRVPGGSFWYSRRYQRTSGASSR